MSNYDQAKSLINKAKVQIMIDSVFYTTLMLGLNHKITNKVKTAGVDGLTVFYNPDFVQKLTLNETVGLIMHELGHVAFQHITRRGDRNHKKWNIAGDYCINNILDEQGYKLPCGALISPSYNEMSSDQVYSLLPDPIEIDFDCDIIEPGSDGSDNTIEVTQQIRELVTKAKTQASLLDPDYKLDSEITRTLEELLNPKLDWRILLQNFMNDFSQEDYSYSRPNRRYQPKYYLPSRYSTSISTVTVAVDTSVSVSQEEIQEYLTEIQSIRDTFNIEHLTVLGCDYKLRNVIEVSPDQSLLDIKLTGGSWTKFSPVFEYLKLNPPTVLIYFTDMDALFDFDEPQFNVLWINTWDDRKAPIGKTININ